MTSTYDNGNPNPEHLVYDGLQYFKTRGTTVGLQQHHYLVVVGISENEFNDLEARETGPEVLVYNGSIYQKSTTDPAHIKDDVLRTVDANYYSLNHPQQGFGLGELNIAPLLAACESPIRGGRVKLPPFFSLFNGYTDPGPVTPRVMPSRSTVTISATLEVLFDLPVHQRSGVIPHPVARTNRESGVDQTTRKRYHWEEIHRQYLFQLVELAMLKLNRPLRAEDFQAITEALHRRFQGTYRGWPYPERGYNTVHSYCVKDDAKGNASYNEIVRRLFP